MKLSNSVRSARVLHDYVVRVVFSDGYVGQVDLAGLFRDDSGPIVEELKNPEQFRTVSVLNDTLTFENGYDICPDVLRFYCERGAVATQEETDAAFEVFLREARVNQPLCVAESRAEYGKGKKGKMAPRSDKTRR